MKNQNPDAVWLSGAVILSPRAAALVARALRTGNEQLKARGGPGFTRQVLACGEELEKASAAGVHASNASDDEDLAGGLVTDSEALSTAEVADQLGIASNSVRDLVRRGRLEARKVGTTWVFDPWTVTAFAQHRRGAA